MKAFILLTLAVAALAGSPKGTPLGRYPTGGKIVGGQPAARGEIPWQVSIQRSSGSQYCGGSIISNNWIVTAAHCSDIIPSNFQIRSGTLTYASGGSVHAISRVIPHENYIAATYLNDIAVWEVSDPFVYGAETGPIGLRAQGAASPAGTATWVSGWGTTSYGGEVSENLLKVDVPIVDYNECDAAYNGAVPLYQICAANSGKDSCQGDSGGPLYFNNELWGVVSWGTGCAFPNYPGVYTEASQYRDWIRANTGV